MKCVILAGGLGTRLSEETADFVGLAVKRYTWQKLKIIIRACFVSNECNK